jgi:hypothetical protein
MVSAHVSKSKDQETSRKEGQEAPKPNAAAPKKAAVPKNAPAAKEPAAKKA